MIPGPFHGVLRIAYGNPLLFGAQILRLGELEGGERAAFGQGERGIGLVIPVEVAQVPAAIVSDPGSRLRTSR